MSHRHAELIFHLRAVTIFVVLCSSDGTIIMSASPQLPSVGDRCTVECELLGAQELMLIVYKSLKNMTALQTIRYGVASNRVDFGSEKWRRQHELTVVRDPGRAFIAITFTTQHTDRTKIQCLSTVSCRHDLLLRNSAASSFFLLFAADAIFSTNLLGAGCPTQAVREGLVYSAPEPHAEKRLHARRRGPRCL